MVTLDLTHARAFLPEHWLEHRLEALDKAHGALLTGSGAGGDFTGWVDLPETALKGEELPRIRAAAQRIRQQSRVLVVIGIGGSYLGARAVYELLENARKDGVELLFAGNGLSTDDTLRTIRAIGERDFSVNVISKSGTTTEPAVAFRIFRALLEQRYGREEARRRIYATTDASRGALCTLAQQEGYERFLVPDAVGGRYSVLTAVGLLPLAAAGVDVDRLLRGALAEQELLLGDRSGANAAWQYAAARHALYEGGKKVELLACYEPCFRSMTEWWKQLFGESEGKEGKGLFPAGAAYTADLHSMGQYVQEGERMLLETVVNFASPLGELTIPADPESADGLEFLAGRPLSFVLEQAMAGTALAHADGGVPNLRIDLGRVTEENAGALLYFFEFACGLSGYLLGVNPFDQPGVEAYKKNMFALLGKPGYEGLRDEILKRL